MFYHFFYEYIFKNYYESYPDFLGFSRLFKYLTFRSVGALLFALILSFVIGPPVIKYLRGKKIGQTIRDDGPQTHLSKAGTPTMGGVLIILTLVSSVLLFADLSTVYIYIMLFATLGFGFIGFLDDYLKLIKKNTKGLSAKKKLIGQFALATIIVSVLYYFQDQLPLYVPFFDEPVINNMGIFFIPFGIIVLVGSTNAVNLTDGLDGLAIGCTIIVAGTFGIMAYLTGNAKIALYLDIPYIPRAGELTVYMAAIVGGGIGFLWYNSHPASVFMGDTGSLAIGGTIGTVALLIKKEFILIIAGGIFVAEAISVLLQVFFYKWKKKRIFKMAPLHHHYEMKGWPESKVIVRFWIVGIILSLAAIATLKIQ